MAGVRVPVEFDGDFSQLTAGMERALSGVSQGLTSAGGALTRGLTVPLVGLGALAGREFAGFESSLTKIENHTGLTRAEIDKLSPSIRDIGTTAGLSGTEAADAFFFLQSGLGDSTRAMDALDAAAKGSAVGLGTTEDVSKALVSVMANYGSEVGSASDIMNVFGSAAQASSLDADQMADGLRGVIPQAALAGVSLDDLAATMAVISPNFNSGSEAGTAMSAAMRAIVAPTKEAEKMLEAAGTSSADLTKVLSKQGLSGAMQFLGETFDGSQKDLTRLLGSSEAASAVMGFLGADADFVARTFKDVEDKTFSLDTAFGNLSDDAGFRVTQSMARIKDTLLDLGGVTLPIAADALERVAAVVQMLATRFTSLSPAGQQVVLAVAGIAAAIGPALLVAGQFAGALSALAGASGFAGAASGALRFLGPIGLVVGILVAAYQASEPFRTAIAGLGATIQQVATAAMPQFMAIGNIISTQLLPVLAGLFTQVAGAIGSLLAAVLPVVGVLISQLLPVILQLITTALPPLIAVFSQVAAIVGTVLPPVLNALALLFSAVLMPAIQAILPIVTAVFTEIGAKVEAASVIFQGLITFLTGVFTGDWNKAWEGIQTAFDGFVTGIQTSVDGWLTALEETLGVSFTDQKAIVDDNLAGISESFTTTTDSIGETVKTGFSTIETTASDHMEDMAGFLKEQWDIMDRESGGAMSDMVSTVSSGMATMASTFGRGWGTITRGTGSATSSIGSTFGRGMGVVTRNAGSAMSQIGATFSRGMSTAVGAIGRGVSGFVSRGATGMASLARVMSTGFGRVVGLARRLPGQVVSAVSGFGNALFRAGSQIISGLIGGIRAAAGRVASAARSVVQNAINAARSALGIASPSKVFMEIGRNTGQGMALGLDATRGLVQAAADRSLVPDITARIGPTGSARSTTPATATVGAGEGTATVVLNEYGPRTDSAKRREVDWILRHPTRGRTFESGQLAIA
jgi:TP901 family phage tail tape measure protein